jgi:hypothetical protein
VGVTPGTALRVRVRPTTVREGVVRAGTVYKGSRRTLQVRVRAGTVSKGGGRVGTVRKGK